MDPPYSAPRPLPLPYPAHHHHNHHLFLCPQQHHHNVIICPRHYIHPNPHHHHCPRFNTYCEGHIPPPLQNQSSSETNPCLPLGTQFRSSTQTLQEPKHVELEEEEEEEHVFVLTDEWRDFFSKSKAKRKLEKQQAKKNRRQLIHGGKLTLRHLTFPRFLRSRATEK